MLDAVSVAVLSLQLTHTHTTTHTHLGGDERLGLKEVKVVAVPKVAEQLACQAVQSGHDGQGQLPTPVAGAVHKLGELQGLVVVEPGETRGGDAGLRVLVSCRLAVDTNW